MGFDQDLANVTGDLLNAMTPLPNYRAGVGITNRDRQVMTWLLPNGSTVQMYINPENFVVKESKQITPTRTKGGYIVQYWGDNLTQLTLAGTTGSAGVRGIQVLRDIYHAENRAFDLIAQSQVGVSAELNTSGNFTTVGNTGQQLVPYISAQLKVRNFIMRPSLASLAVGIILYYQGIQYKGFFTGITVTEGIDKLGLFTYNIEFSATEIRGSRSNFMAWHREPVADDPTGQFVNAMTSKIGNLARGALGMSPAQVTPETFHPESAPLSFGGNSLASQFGVQGGVNSSSAK